MLHRQVEHAGLAAIWARRCRRQIIPAVHANLEMNDRMIHQQFTQPNLSPKCRYYLDPHDEFLSMQQRRLIRRLHTTHRDVVEMSGEPPQAEIEPADLRPAARGLICLLDNLANRELLEAAAAEVYVSSNNGEQHQDCQPRHHPADSAFPLHHCCPLSKKPARS